MCLGMVFDFEYQVVRIYYVYANHKNTQDHIIAANTTIQFIENVWNLVLFCDKWTIELRF